MNTDHDEQDDLWRLLGKAREQTPSPFFSRNVLRAIREEQQEKRSPFAWLRGRWQVAAVGVCAVAVAMISLRDIPQPHQSPDANTIVLADLAEKVSQSSDFQVIANLDELLASKENSVWLEN